MGVETKPAIANFAPFSIIFGGHEDAPTRLTVWLVSITVVAVFVLQPPLPTPQSCDNCASQEIDEKYNEKIRKIVII